MMTDPIADMLTRIRNASLVRKSEVSVPYSKLKKGIVDILVREGYLTKAEVSTGKPAFIILSLKYSGGLPAINSLKRLSKPGHRRYVKSDKIPATLNGLGLSIISTPRGLLTNKEARRDKVGGEIICEVY